MGSTYFPLLLVEKKIYVWFRDKSGVASRCSLLRAEAAEKLLETDDARPLERTLYSSEPSRAHQPFGGLEAITTSPRPVVERPAVSGKSAKENLSFLYVQCALL